MNRKIALLPVDGRPVTRDLPRQIARIADWGILLPDRDQLGFLKKPANIEGLHKWLEDVAPKVDGFVISIDMLGYGGLVPSRISKDTTDKIRSRLALIQVLKARFPEKTMMAFSATMRISDSYVNEEEKEYWSEYGKEIWMYSYYTHHYEKADDEKSLEKSEDLKKRIPEEILQDYLQTRERNFAVNRSLLEDVESGFIDLLIYPQDDTSEYGLNIREQEQLSHEIAERSLFSKVLVYPGADEVACTLATRMILEMEGVSKPIFYPFFSGETGALVPAMYEDRPIIESVKGQVFALGGFIAPTSSEADIALAVNVPGKRQGDLALQMNLEEVDTPDRNIGEWLLRIKHHVSKGKVVAVADLGYANGADEAMMTRMLHEGLFDKLSGFAAWNTAGNSLGTVVAHAAMVHLQKEKPSLSEKEWKRRLLEQLFLRLLDDYLYQSVVRQEVRGQIDESRISAAALRNKTIESFEGRAKELLRPLLSPDQWTITNIFMPWDRTFEIGVTFQLYEWGDKKNG